MDNINSELDKMKNELESMKNGSYQKHNEKYCLIRNVLTRIIYRIYPKEDAERLIKEINPIYVCGGNDNSQKHFELCVNSTIRIIKTIKIEAEIFGFDDFNPIKEKVETEYQVGSDKIGYIRKKTTK